MEAAQGSTGGQRRHPGCSMENGADGVEGLAGIAGIGPVGVSTDLREAGHAADSAGLSELGEDLAA